MKLPFSPVIPHKYSYARSRTSGKTYRKCRNSVSESPTKYFVKKTNVDEFADKKMSGKI